MGDRAWSYVQLANELSMSASEINAGVKRCLAANLLVADFVEGKNPKPALKAVEEFLVHGLKYAFVPEKGELTGGVPTGYAAEPLKGMILVRDEPPPVWPYLVGRCVAILFLRFIVSRPRPLLQIRGSTSCLSWLMPFVAAKLVKGASLFLSCISAWLANGSG